MLNSGIDFQQGFSMKISTSIFMSGWACRSRLFVIQPIFDKLRLTAFLKI